MPRQLHFDLAVKPALGREDFMVAPSNALAVRLIDDWPDWQAGKLLLTGPRGSGKTHLAHVWAKRADARVIAAREIVPEDVPGLADQPIAIEDLPAIAGQADIEAALFHLHNMTLANRHSILFTGEGVPAAWPLTLPDLHSRLMGATHAVLSAPDETLLSAVLAKLFADRQILPHPDVIPYLVAHMDRSFDAAQRIVETLDALSLSEKRAITRPLAAKLLQHED